MGYFLKPSAVRDLKKFPKDVQRRIIKKLDFYAGAVNPLRFAEPLQEKRIGEYRFRIGDYRALFDITHGKIVILAIGHRREIYK